MSRSAFPSMLTFREKHDKSHYLLNDETDYVKALYTILKERYELGYYYPSVERAEKDLNSDIKRMRERAELDATLLTLSDEQVEALPEALMVKAKETREASAALEVRIAKYRQREESSGDLWFATNVERIMKMSSAEAIEDTFEYRGRALNTVKNLMSSRKDHEYEDYYESSFSEFAEF